MPAKNPHTVLGIEAGASPDEIKAAWRSLARRNHPDLIGDDPETARRATSRMAEINAAYAALTRAGETQEAHSRARQQARPATGAARGTRGGNGSTGTAPGQGSRTGGPPPPPRTRPVTGRLDLSGSVRPTNQTTTPPGARSPLQGQPPLRWGRSEPELRASQPTGPLETRLDPRHVPPTMPSLDEALELEVDFGKFHGHTLGEIAAFEPSYIDWLAATLAREPELTMAARVIREELDRRGIQRAQRPARPGWQSNPFR
jgi:curved DNA-binding protein CbpA